jgi:hypothetical protein
MSGRLVKEILAAAGKPVAGHTLSVEEMRQAVEKERVIEFYFWSTTGEHETWFGFAKNFGLDYEGRVHPTYLIFPRPIPPELRLSCSPE